MTLKLADSAEALGGMRVNEARKDLALTLFNYWAIITRIFAQDQPGGVLDVIPDKKICVEPTQEKWLSPRLGWEPKLLSLDAGVIRDRTDEATLERSRHHIPWLGRQSRSQLCDGIDRVHRLRNTVFEAQGVKAEHAESARLTGRAVQER